MRRDFIRRCNRGWSHRRHGLGNRKISPPVTVGRCGSQPSPPARRRAGTAHQATCRRVGTWSPRNPDRRRLVEVFASPTTCAAAVTPRGGGRPRYLIGTVHSRRPVLNRHQRTSDGASAIERGAPHIEHESQCDAAQRNEPGGLTLADGSRNQIDPIRGLGSFWHRRRTGASVDRSRSIFRGWAARVRRPAI